jgi:hypothetical protein
VNWSRTNLIIVGGFVSESHSRDWYNKVHVVYPIWKWGHFLAQQHIILYNKRPFCLKSSNTAKTRCGNQV